MGGRREKGGIASFLFTFCIRVCNIINIIMILLRQLAAQIKNIRTSQQEMNTKSE